MYPSAISNMGITAPWNVMVLWTIIFTFSLLLELESILELLQPYTGYEVAQLVEALRLQAGRSRVLLPVNSLGMPQLHTSIPRPNNILVFILILCFT
jgi:hypothetical protein